MGQFQPKVFSDILQRMINTIVARTDLNDLNDGSVLKQILAAAAREDDDQYTQALNLLDLFDIDKAQGPDLDERAKDYNPLLIVRNPAQTATGSVVFSRTGTVGTIVIPVGSQVQVPSDTTLKFITTEEGTILAGFTTAAAVDVVAADAGTRFNVDPGTITGFAAKPSGVDFVTNPSAITNGLDIESDDSFRARIKTQVLSLARCTVSALEAAALDTVDTGTGKRVVFANVVEDDINLGNVTLFIDDGSGTAETTAAIVGEAVLIAVGGETTTFLTNIPVKEEIPFTVFVNAVAKTENVDYTLNPASGQIRFLPASYPAGLIAADAVTANYTHYTGLVQLTQKVIDGDPADRANFPGFRAAGVLVKVKVPDIVQISVTANITVRQGFNQETVATQVAANISEYINGLGISGDVILNELVERAMSVAGMFDIGVSSPTGNIVILDDQLARILAANLAIN